MKIKDMNSDRDQTGTQDDKRNLEKAIRSNGLKYQSAGWEQLSKRAGTLRKGGWLTQKWY